MHELELIGVSLSPVGGLALLATPDRQRGVSVPLDPLALLALDAVSVPSERPQTPMLLLNVLGALGAHLERVMLVAWAGAEVICQVHVRHGARRIVMDADPGSALALARTAGVPIGASAAVMGDALQLGAGHERELTDFREFLDHVEPGDFRA